MDTERIARVCSLLGIAHPVIQAGMTAVGDARLAAAVSAAGGLGLVSAGRMTPQAFGDEIDRALALTDRPVGVNLPVVRDAARMHGLLAQALARRVALVVLGGGNPAPWAAPVLSAGCRLAVVTATPRQARGAQALGASAVIVAGHEAGGTSGEAEVGGLVLIPAVVDAVGVPVVAAGGIVDGRSAAAAICLGASAVQLGTRFMLSDESPLHERTRQAMLAAGVGDTLIAGRAHGMGRRLLATAAARRIVERERGATLEELVSMVSGDRSERGLRAGDIDDGTVSCGQGVGRITQVEPVATIVTRIAAEMRAVLAGAAVALDRAAGATRA